MQIYIISLFEQMFDGFFNYSIIKKAQEKKLVEITFINPRDFATDNYKTVDDKPYGGGAGMVMKVKPLYKCLQKIKNLSAINHADKVLQVNKTVEGQVKIQASLKLRGTSKMTNKNSKIILTSAKGIPYSQQKAQQYSKLNYLIIIAGHYEGVDQRITSYIDQEVSIGDYVLSGGEIAAAAIIDSVIRLIPGVIDKDSLIHETFMEIFIDDLLDIIGSHPVLIKMKSENIKKIKLLEYPQYTRPDSFRQKKVPKILLTGHHLKINRWRIKKAFELTIKMRPDILNK